MEPVVMIVVPGILGGFALAFLIVRLHRTALPDAGRHRSADGPLPLDVINMSRIRVAGVGGLGLLAMALVVAYFVPRIGQTLAVGLLLGITLGLGLILRRRRVGPISSSGRHPGANTVLAIDHAKPIEQDGRDDSARQEVCAGELSERLVSP